MHRRLHCVRCADRVLTVPELAGYSCGACGSNLVFRIQPASDLAQLIERDRGLPWRYHKLLPVEYEPGADDGLVPPVTRSRVLESRLGVARVWLVDCTVFGTGTFKDLEAAVVIAIAKQLGIGRISVHSTGNTALAYRHYAIRLGVTCAAFLPRMNIGKLGDIEPNLNAPIFAVDAEYAQVSDVAKRAAARDGIHHMAPLRWKLEGKATIAWLLRELQLQVDLIVQTVAGGYGVLGVETGFRRVATALGEPAVAPSRPGYLLFQPSDADTLVRAWNTGATELSQADLRLPRKPLEPTLQSTNPLATLPLLRRILPAETVFQSVPVQLVDDSKPVIDAALHDAGIDLDYGREKSAYISLAGLLHTQLRSSARLAVIITGSPPFQSGLAKDTWQVVKP